MKVLTKYVPYTRTTGCERRGREMRRPTVYSLRRLVPLALTLCVLLGAVLLCTACSRGTPLSAPTGTRLDEITLTLSWNKVKGAAYYTVRIRPDDGSDAVEKDASKPSLSLESLTEGSYELRVRLIEKFCERALKFALLKNTDGKFFSLDDYRKAIEPAQTDKDKNVVYLYATKPEEQYSFIEAAKNMGYDVLLMDCELDSHWVNLLESKIEHTRFARVDSDSVANLIKKEEAVKPELSEDDKKALGEMFKAVLPEGNDYRIEAENLGETSAPVLITQSEFMRRYREMSSMGGGMNFYGSLPESYNILVNMQNPLVLKIWGEKKDAADQSVADFVAANELLHQVVDLALLSNGMLKGKDLADFVSRSEKFLSEQK